MVSGGVLSDGLMDNTMDQWMVRWTNGRYLKEEHCGDNRLTLYLGDEIGCYRNSNHNHTYWQLDSLVQAQTQPSSSGTWPGGR